MEMGKLNVCICNADGDIEKLRDELLALCDKLKEGDATLWSPLYPTRKFT